LPDSSSDVVIDQGDPKVTASFGTIASLKISRYPASLRLIDAGASAVAGAVTVSGGLDLDAASGDGGSSLTIGGRLTNYGGIQIGPGTNNLSAASTIEAARLSNIAKRGTIELLGSSIAQATLDVTSAAGFGTKGTLTGDVDLSGDALVEFKAGQIATIAASSILSLTGSHAFVADASNTSSNSALRGLNAVTGDLDLANGAAVKTAGDLANTGGISIDALSSEDDGGSLLSAKGTLTNSGTVSIGISTLSANSTLEAASIVNDGTIDVTGDRSNNIDATLLSAGAFTNDGSVNFSNDFDRIAGAVSGTGTFNLASGSALDFGAGVSSGETVAFGTASGVDSLALDAASLFDGTIDDFSDKGDTVVAKTFAYGATTFLYTQTGADSCSWTLTDGANTAVLNFAGEPYVESDFSIVSANGGLGSAIVLKTGVGPNYWEGGTANWDTPSDWSGGLPRRTSNVVIEYGSPEVTASFGTVDSIDISYPNAGLTFVDAGASSVAGNVTNFGESFGGFSLDLYTGDGGSSLKIGGALTNDTIVQIGPSNDTLSATSMIEAASVINDGTIDLYGNQAANANATLRSSGAFTNDGSVNLTDDYDKLAGAVSGAGDFDLSTHSRLEFGAGVSSGESVTFTRVDKLLLDQASSFNGTIDDFFTKGDSVVARTFAEAQTLLSYTQTGADSCSWTLTDGTQTAVLNFAGEPYTQSDFSIASANGGKGLEIKFVG
jgi:Hyphally regulated cell wall protein N-terminal